jgi:hypothetical protein
MTQSHYEVEEEAIRQVVLHLSLDSLDFPGRVEIPLAVEVLVRSPCISDRTYSRRTVHQSFCSSG